MGSSQDFKDFKDFQDFSSSQVVPFFVEDAADVALVALFCRGAVLDELASADGSGTGAGEGSGTGLGSSAPLRSNSGR